MTRNNGLLAISRYCINVGMQQTQNFGFVLEDLDLGLNFGFGLDLDLDLIFGFGLDLTFDVLDLVLDLVADVWIWFGFVI
ncbi:unnamed protein product [Rotaria magnacalcarata]